MSSLINSESIHFLCSPHHNQAQHFCSHPDCALRLLCSACRETHDHSPSEFKNIDAIQDIFTQRTPTISNGFDKSSKITQIIKETKDNWATLQNGFKLYDLASQKLLENLNDDGCVSSSLNPIQQFQQSFGNSLFERKLYNGELEKISSLTEEIDSLFMDYNTLLQELSTELEKEWEPKDNQNFKLNLAVDGLANEFGSSKPQLLNRVLTKCSEGRKIDAISCDIDLETETKLNWKQIINSSSYEQQIANEKRKEKFYYESGKNKPEILQGIQQNIKMLQEAQKIGISLKANVKYNLPILEKLLEETEIHLDKENHFFLNLSEKIMTLQSLSKEKKRVVDKISDLKEGDESQINELFGEIKKLKSSCLEIENKSLDQAEEKLKHLHDKSAHPSRINSNVEQSPAEDISQPHPKRPNVLRPKKNPSKKKSLRSELKFFWGKELVWRKTSETNAKSKKNPAVNSLYVERVCSRTREYSNTFPRSFALLEDMLKQIHEQEDQLNRIISSNQGKLSPKKFADFVRKVDSSVIISENVDKKINDVVKQRVWLENESNLFANMTFKPPSLLEKMEKFEEYREKYPLKSRKFHTIHKEIELFKSIYHEFEAIKADPSERDFESVVKKIALFKDQVGGKRYQKTIKKIENELALLKDSQSRAPITKIAMGLESFDGNEVIEISSSDSETEMQRNKENLEPEIIFEEYEPAITKKVKNDVGDNLQTMDKIQNENIDTHNSQTKLLYYIVDIIESRENSEEGACEMKKYAKTLADTVEEVINENSDAADSYRNAIKILLTRTQEYEKSWVELQNSDFEKDLLKKLLLRINDTEEGSPEKLSKEKEKNPAEKGRKTLFSKVTSFFSLGRRKDDK